MRTHRWLGLMVIVVAALAFGAASAFVGTTAARADTATPPALAGLVSNGTVYIDVGDGYWHYINAATFAKDGYSVHSITWYQDVLPGTIGEPVVPAAGNVALAEVAVTPALAGLLTDGTVYVAGVDGFWHYVDAATFVKAGYDPHAIAWYGDSLPGTIGEPVVPATGNVALAEVTVTPVLAGLLTDGSVYMAGDDGYWHHVDAATFAENGYGVHAIMWYGELPGSIAPAQTS